MRLLQGRVVVREHLNADVEEFTHIIVPAVSTRDDRDAIMRNRTWHRGTVLAVGPPAQFHGNDVPLGFEVGDVVLFHWVHSEVGNTRPWTDGLPACWIPQNAIDAVIES